MKVIITVIGNDKPGIIAKVSTALADSQVNIEDISQTLMQNKFTMLMLCDISKATLSLKEIQNCLYELGQEIGVSIHVQHEDIFNAMHKI